MKRISCFLLLVFCTVVPRVPDVSAQESILSRSRSALRAVKATASRLIPFSGDRQPDHVPQLGRIYSRAAQYEHLDRNPVIVIPGILGSRLVDAKNQKTIWGTIQLSQTRPLSHSADIDIALPMAYEQDLSTIRDDVFASDILGDLKLTILGIPIEISAYREVLSTLGVGGYRSEAASILGQVDYGNDHFTCFEFHYDWRRDCTENAAKLSQFIEQKTTYVQKERHRRFGSNPDEPVRFDIVAHSMGALITRYFLRYGSQTLSPSRPRPKLNWAGAANVETVILVGPPNAGSVESILQAVNGLQFSKVIPKYDAAILGTMPSVYQLLPRPRHGVVVDAATGKSLNTYDWKTWQAHQWGLLDPREDPVLQKLIPNSTKATRQAVAIDHLQKSLWQAWQFHRLLDAPSVLPESTSIFLIAGDSELTHSRVASGAGSMKVIEQAPGDGTVTRASTLMDERLSDGQKWTPRLKTPIHWSGTTFIFTDHLDLTANPAFTDNALYLLLERPRQ